MYLDINKIVIISVEGKVLYIISICIILLGLYKRKSNVVFIMMLFWMWILFAFNYNNADYAMYEQLYINNDFATHNIEIFFRIICEIAIKIGLSYRTFIMFYSIIPIALIGTSIKKYTKNPSFALSCYFIFPFLIDIVQIRHFMAIAIITYAFQFLLSDNKKDIYKYILLNFVAIGFHISAIAYLFFALAKKLDNRKIRIALIFGIFLLIILIESNLLPTILSNFIPYDKVEVYFISSRWRPGLKTSIMYMIIQTSIVAIMTIIYKYWKKHSLKIDQDEEWNRRNNIVTCVYKINIILMIILPFYLYSTQLIRIVRGMLLLNYIAIGNVLEPKKVKDNYVIYLLTILVIAFLFYMLVIKTKIFSTTIDLIMNYNYLLKG